MAATSEEVVRAEREEKLTDIFEKGFKIFYDLNSSTEPSNSAKFQTEVKKGIELLERATIIVNEVGVFSSNEQIEEVPSADLKYLLLPAVLGSLTLKLVGASRLEIIEAAEVYFKDYLERLGTYGIHVPKKGHSENDAGPSTSEDNGDNAARNTIPPELVAMVRMRNDKINRYKQQQELEKKRLVLKELIEKDTVEDETVREYYTVMFDMWITTALEELESIELEKPIVAHMASLKLEGKQTKLPPPSPKNSLKPVIIAKNELQKQVFGIGYPSIPTMTVNEFYQQRYGENAKEHEPAALSLQKMCQNPEHDALEREQEDAEKEKILEEDDEDAIRKAREWDDWKDDHRRGWGNRKNMG